MLLLTFLKSLNIPSPAKQVERYRHSTHVSTATTKWLEGFKQFLLAQDLAQNTRKAYFEAICHALRMAHKSGMIATDITVGVKAIQKEETRREFLTIEELTLLNNTPCQNDQLKRMFLFGCLTGYRWSDISALRWEYLFHSESMGHYIRMQIKKNGAQSTKVISEQAVSLLGDRKEGLVFSLTYSSHLNDALREWVLEAGIDKEVSFHCGRHSQAVALLAAGHTLSEVQDRLDHSSVQSTQVYAKIMDSAKIRMAASIRI